MIIYIPNRRRFRNTVASQIKKNNRLSNFICSYFLISALNMVVKVIWGGFAAWTYLSKGVLAVLLLIALSSLSKRELILFFICEFLAAFLFGITYLLGTYNEKFGSIVFNALAVYLPMGLCLLNMVSTEVFLQKMYFFSFPIQILLMYLSVSFQDVTNLTYSMSVGYGLLLPCFVMIEHYLKTKKTVDVIFVFADVLLTLLYGSRGPFLCYGVYFIIRILILNKSTVTKKILLAVIIAITTITLPQLVKYLLISFAPDEWLHSRTISLMLSGTVLTHDSGRGVLKDLYWQKIIQHPLLGYGLSGGWVDGSLYPHNIAIEMLLSFGMPAGCTLLVYIVYILFQSLKKGSDTDRSVAAILISVNVQLLISGSFILSTTFFMVLAMGIRSRKYK